MANEANVDRTARTVSTPAGTTPPPADGKPATGPVRRQDRRDDMLRERRQERINLRERQKRQRTINLMAIGGVAILVLGIAGWLAVNAWGDYQGRQRLDDVIVYQQYTDAELLADSANTTGSPFQHVEGPLTYPENPPAGGPHNPVWQTCGYYPAPIPAWHAVHSLEHGAIWITYDPALPEGDIDELREMAEEQDFLLVSPMDGLPAPVVASSWGYQLHLDGVDDNGLEAFIDEYRTNPDTTPEFGATCSGGNTGTQVGAPA